MNEKSSVNAGMVTNVAASAAVAGATAAAATGSTGVGIAVAAAGAALPTVLGEIANVFAGMKDRQAASWWKQVVARSGVGSSEDLQKEIARNKDNPSVCKVIAESMRSLLNTVDDAPVEALGSLTGEYLREGKKPDAFFRGAARALSDMTDEEFASFKRVIQATQSIPSDRVVEAIVEVLNGHEVVNVYWNKDARRVRNTVDRVAEPRRLLHLLKVYGLGEDMPAIAYDTDSGPYVVVIRSDVRAKLLSILGTEND